MVVAGYAIANLAKPLLAFVNAWWQVLLIASPTASPRGGTTRTSTAADLYVLLGMDRVDPRYLKHFLGTVQGGPVEGVP